MTRRARIRLWIVVVLTGIISTAALYPNFCIMGIADNVDRSPDINWRCHGPIPLPLPGMWGSENPVDPNPLGAFVAGGAIAALVGIKMVRRYKEDHAPLPEEFDSET